MDAADCMVPVPYVVRRLRPENHDTFTLELSGAERRGRFRPGQFNMLYVFGVGEVPISMSGDPARDTVILHTTRQVGAVTRAMGRLRRGDFIGVRGPFGRPWPVDLATGRDLLIVAGGVGLAPLRPAVYEVLSRRAEFGHVTLLYGARSPDDLLFRDELESWRGGGGMNVEVSVDHATPTWPGHVGVVTGLIARAALQPRSTLAFLCGPEIMMRFAAEALAKRGVDTTDIFVSLERNMKCAVGICGHCQLGPAFVCKDGPVFAYERVKALLDRREV